MKAEINTLKLKVREKKRNKNVCSVCATEPNSVRFGVLCSKLHLEQWIEEQVFIKKCNFSQLNEENQNRHMQCQKKKKMYHLNFTHTNGPFENSRKFEHFGQGKPGKFR